MCQAPPGRQTSTSYGDLGADPAPWKSLHLSMVVVFVQVPTKHNIAISPRSASPEQCVPETTGQCDVGLRSMVQAEQEIDTLNTGHRYFKYRK